MRSIAADVFHVGRQVADGDGSLAEGRSFDGPSHLLEGRLGPILEHDILPHFNRLFVEHRGEFHHGGSLDVAGGAVAFPAKVAVIVKHAIFQQAFEFDFDFFTAGVFDFKTETVRGRLE